MKLMKYFVQRRAAQFVHGILKTTPQRAMSTDELFIRVDMQKKFLVAKDELFLENEEHKIALRAVDEFPYIKLRHRKFATSSLRFATQRPRRPTKALDKSKPRAGT